MSFCVYQNRANEQNMKGYLQTKCAHEFTQCLYFNGGSNDTSTGDKYQICCAIHRRSSDQYFFLEIINILRLLLFGTFHKNSTHFVTRFPLKRDFILNKT